MNEKRPKSPLEAVAPKKQFFLIRLYCVFSMLIVLGLALAVVLTWLGHMDHHIDLFAHPQLIYTGLILLFFPGILLARAKRKGFWLTLGLLVIFHQAYMIAPWYFIPKVKAPHLAGQSTLKILLANVNSSNTETEAFKQKLKEANPDMCVILEVNEQWAAALRELEEDYPHQLIQAREDNFGIAIISKLPDTHREIIIIDETTLRRKGLAAVPSLIFVTAWQGKPFQLIATHPVPPISQKGYASRNYQWVRMLEMVEKTNTPTIVAGDMNLTPWSMVYRMNLYYNKLENAALGHGIYPTWPTDLPMPLQIPIDHILIDPNFKSTSFTHFDFPGSDHRGVMTTLIFTDDQENKNTSTNAGN